jgi:hypothetical protein
MEHSSVADDDNDLFEELARFKQDNRQEQLLAGTENQESTSPSLSLLLPRDCSFFYWQS